MSNKRTTQCDRIVRHLEAGKSITGAEAMYEYGIQHLASRIVELKDKGYPIDSIFETRLNRFGEQVSYKRYFLTGGAYGERRKELLLGKTDNGLLP